MLIIGETQSTTIYNIITGLLSSQTAVNNSDDIGDGSSETTLNSLLFLYKQLAQWTLTISVAVRKQA